MNLNCDSQYISTERLKSVFIIIYYNKHGHCQKILETIFSITNVIETGKLKNIKMIL